MDPWAALLEELSGQVSILVGKDIEVLPSLGFVPALSLVSADLYPHSRPDLVQVLRRNFPKMDVAVIVSPAASTVPLRQLLLDRVRHLAVADPREGAKRVRTLINAICEGKSWELMSYLDSDAGCQEFRMDHLDKKEEVLSSIENMIVGTAPDLENLRQSSVLLADEMIENAFHAAPPGSSVPEPVIIRAGFDGETLALQVIDAWGSLTPEKALELLTRHQEGQITIDSPRGRGLFILWQFFDHLHINVKAGRQTAIGGQLRRKSYSNMEQPKGFDFFHSFPCS
jgi:hypothetical protein